MPGAVKSYSEQSYHYEYRINGGPWGEMTERDWGHTVAWMDLHGTTSLRADNKDGLLEVRLIED